MAGYRELSSRLAAWTGTIGAFSRKLDREGTPYISFSKVSSVEFCSYRYLLEYVDRKRLRPAPDYFVNGRAFHEAAARVYRRLARGMPPDVTDLLQFLTRRVPQPTAELENAVRVAAQNVHEGWEVVGVEEPFVISLGRSLPPCVGVADLVLRRGGTFAVVDHKTGKKFYGADELQLVLYREYVRRRYGATRCLTIVDEYRWVSDLARIRKPAFQRQVVQLGRNAWSQAIQRIASAWSEIREIEKSREAYGGGECFRCPFKGICPKASVGYSSWWW
jgi:predicted RecB family nuclease